MLKSLWTHHMATVIALGSSLMISWLLDEEPVNESYQSDNFHLWRLFVKDKKSDPSQIFFENYVMWFSVFGSAYCLLYSPFGKKAFSSFKYYPSAFPETSLLIREFFRSARGVFIASALEIICSNYYENKSLPFIQTNIELLNKKSFELNVTQLIIVLLCMALWGDAHFYVTHRILHTKWLYKNVHKVHHESIHPDPWAGLSMHPLESAVYFSAGPLLAICCPFWMVRTVLRGLIVFPLEGHTGMIAD